MHKKSMEAAAHLESVGKSDEEESDEEYQMNHQMSKKSPTSSLHIKTTQDWRTGSHFTDNLHTAVKSPPKRSGGSHQFNKNQLIAMTQQEQHQLLSSAYQLPQFHYAANN
jgi:hypothetical protein